MGRLSEMNEIIPGLLVGCADDAEQMVKRGADVLVPLAYLDGSIWNTRFRGEILYYPINDMGILPDDVLRVLVDSICSRLDEGKKVGVFCSAGHGRTGYVAACVLARRGIRDPIGYLRRNYSAKAIESEKQINEVFAYARSLRAEQISAEGLGEHFFEYRSYRGGDPYVYLSFSEWDDDAAPETVRILNELGFRVAYDRAVLEGRLWSGSRSDAIENCSLFVTISTPCEFNSHIRYADYQFAEQLEKPIAFIEMDQKNWEYLLDDDDYIVGIPSDPGFADRCLKVLTQKGMVPCAEQPEAGDSAERPARRKPFRPVRRWDLGLSALSNLRGSATATSAHGKRSIRGTTGWRRRRTKNSTGRSDGNASDSTSSRGAAVLTTSRTRKTGRSCAGSAASEANRCRRSAGNTRLRRRGWTITGGIIRIWMNSSM